MNSSLTLRPSARGLRKAQMVSIRRTPAADQARLLGYRFDMLPVANPTRRRQCQYALVDRGASSLSLSEMFVRLFVSPVYLQR